MVIIPKYKEETNNRKFVPVSELQFNRYIRGRESWVGSCRYWYSSITAPGYPRDCFIFFTRDYNGEPIILNLRAAGIIKGHEESTVPQKQDTFVRVALDEEDRKNKKEIIKVRAIGYEASIFDLIKDIFRTRVPLRHYVLEEDLK